MDLKQLEYFVHVAQFGGFSRAANFLGIAQPALSKQIRLLEVEFRQTLLVRNGRGVTLTDAGRRLLSHGIGLLQQAEHARLAMEEERGATVGRVTIGMPPSVGRLLTVRMVKEFRKRHPKAQLGIVEGLSTHIAEWLHTGRIDIGLIYNPTPSPGIETEPLMEEELYLMRPAPEARKRREIAPPVSLAEVAKHPLVIPSRPHAIRMLLETQMANAGVRIDVMSEVDGVPAILELVSQGLGSAVLSLNAIIGTPLESVITPYPIVDPQVITVLTLATSTQRPGTPLMQASAALLHELVEEHVQNMQASAYKLPGKGKGKR
jgi:LysR family nitrogen assimilation transcriptional regulator